jgi:predicted amidohydrolase YtcJ
MSSTLFRNVEVAGNIVSVRITNGLIADIADHLVPSSTDEIIDGKAGALVPGLHDHHIHLLALAAAMESIDVGPPGVTGHADLHLALQRGASNARYSKRAWLRAVGYHDSVAGALDRYALDRIVYDLPLKVQYRTGSLWMLNSRAIEVLQLDQQSDPAIERDAEGQPTGRLFGADDLLRKLSPSVEAAPNLQNVSARLRSYGVTGVTDATPFSDRSSIDLLDATDFGAMVVVMGGTTTIQSIADQPPRRLGVGPVKLVVGDHALPSIDDLIDGIRRARSSERAVAMHCVTRVGLVLALAAWEATGVREGDRIEHGGVIDHDQIDTISSLDLTVVTQPNFVCERGDRYLEEVETHDLPHLYRCASLIERGIRVGGSTDAPFGHPDPWQAMRAAVERRTANGLPIGPDEKLSARGALKLFLAPLPNPGGPPRTVAEGEPADVCLLHVPLAQALVELSKDNVRQTFHAKETFD